MGQAVLSDPINRYRDGVPDIVSIAAICTVARQPPVTKGNRVNIPDPVHGDWCILALLVCI